ncbi:MAG: carboxypeptidase regulatory-like domain-containing protein [Deltaproteobacteria bacterium]|nr:carboxypeptidase regulatory-like domain-containing protein [Deltaproteobacteria bacterium]
MSKRFTTFSLALALGLGSTAGAEPKNAEVPWAGEEMPLPLAVRTPEDLAVKAAAERAYLVFNLLAGGKVAWDAGRYGVAAQKWEHLLSLAGLDAETARVVRPLATEARRRAGGEAAAPIVAPATPAAPQAEAAAEVAAGSVKGTVQGGGSLGPGGTVVWLRRKDGPTPRPAPLRGREMTQRDKTFVPHVLPVTLGSKVAFHNEDTIFHNVFSLSRPNDFDGGLYKDGASYSKTFTHAGAVQVLCNIHAQMLGYVVVVDSPWFAQAGSSGRFTIRGVPPGAYELIAWHESSSDVTRQPLQVQAGTVAATTITLGSERSRLKFVPDKYGKPRQVQLGY